MSEIGLGIGRYQGIVAGIPQELLLWYNEMGDLYLTGEEQAQQERLRAEQERQRAQQEQLRAEQLAQYLRSLGFDPDNLPSE
jgi:hypothetical protein